MSCQEAKSKIITLLDNLPEKYAYQLLEHLKDIQAVAELDQETSIHLEKILDEDDSLLHRLAQ